MNTVLAFHKGVQGNEWMSPNNGRFLYGRVESEERGESLPFGEPVGSSHVPWAYV